MDANELRDIFKGESGTALVQSLSRAERAQIKEQGDLIALLAARGDTIPWHEDAVAAVEQLLISHPQMMQDYPEFK